MANIRISSLPATTTVQPDDVVPLDGATTRKIKPSDLLGSVRPIATQSQAEAGTDNTTAMTPLATAQAIAAKLPNTAAGRAMLAAASTADQRTLLALGGAAQLNVGSTAGTVAAGDDIRFAGVAGIVDQATAEAGIDNTGLMSPLRVTQHLLSHVGTLGGTVAAGDDTRFTFLQAGTGAIVRSNQDKSREIVSVKDFGVVGDGATDDTAAINAIESDLPSGATLYWPAGQYLISAPINKGPASWLACDGAVLIAKSGWAFGNLTGMVTGSNLSDFVIDGLTFDLSGGVFAPGVGLPGNIYWALAMFTSTRFTIRNCRFEGIKAQIHAIGTITCNHFTIIGNSFRMPVPSGAFSQSINTSDASGPSSFALIADNDCDGAAISLASSNVIVRGNHIRNWKYGSGVTVNPVGLTGVHIVDNHISGGAGLDDNGAYPGGIEHWGFYSTISGNVCYGNASDGISVSGQYNTVVGNVCQNNGVEAGAHGVGIKLGSLDNTYNASYCVVHSNVCIDSQGVGATQEYGIHDVVLSGSNQTNYLELGANILAGNKLGKMGPQTSAKMSFRGPSVWGSAPFTPGTLAPGAYNTVSVTVPGARAGDLLTASFDQNLSHVTLHPYIVGDDTVFVQFTNTDTSNVTIGAGTVRVRASKPPTYGSF